jgi:hypothetical protein
MHVSQQKERSMVKGFAARARVSSTLIIIKMMMYLMVVMMMIIIVPLQRVVANVCLASVEAELLGVNRHVCEVELATAAFVRAQARYGV